MNLRNHTHRAAAGRVPSRGVRGSPPKASRYPLAFFRFSITRPVGDRAYTASLSLMLPIGVAS